MINIPKKLSSEIIDKYRVTNNTLVQVVNDDWREKLEVEIGDIKQYDFKPQIKIKKWDNEVNFSVRLIDNEEVDPLLSTDRDKMIWKKGKREVNLYDIPISEEHPEGGYEFEIILNEKPKTNKIEFSIETKGLNFYKQTELVLSQRDIERFDSYEKSRQKLIDLPDYFPEIFSSRVEYEEMIAMFPDTLEEEKFRLQPENVIGSYAVYHSTKKDHVIGQKNYKVGKAFHIYRPQMIDANGRKVWGEIDIDVDNKIQTITIPQEFLDNAIYPIRHAAGLTFGYTGTGTNVVEAGNRIIIGKATGAVATLIKMTAYFRSWTLQDPTVKTKCAIYDGNDVIANGETDERNNDSTSFAWRDYIFSGTQPTVSAIEYSLAFWSNRVVVNASWVDHDIYYDTNGPANKGGYDNETYDGWPTLSLTLNNDIPSLYATYSSGRSVEQKIQSTNLNLWLWGYTNIDAGGATSIKSWNGLAKASIKSINGLAIASVKSINNLA